MTSPTRAWEWMRIERWLSRSKRVIAPLLFLISALAVAADRKIAPSLETVLAAAGPNDSIPVLIVLNGGPTREDVLFAAQGKSGEERRVAVRELLRPAHTAIQASLLRALNEAQASGQSASRIQPLWIANIVGARLSPTLIRKIAGRPEVERINATAGPARLFDRASSAGTDGPIDCGLTQMRVPEVWSNYSNRGEGIVVALPDNGTCWSHTDLKNHIWVNPGEDIDHDGVVMDNSDKNGVDDDGNGFVDDLIGWDFASNDNDPAPTGSDEHGTQTAGAIVGDGTAGEQTGVAPGAKLMPMRVNLDSLDGDIGAWQALQYAADNGADIISMSFGWYHADLPDRTAWRDVLDNVLATGAIVIGASGNAGSSSPPDDVGTPPDVPGVIAVGATDCNDTIANFSSQGPTSWGDVHPYHDYPYPPGLLKPEISAPGVSTRTTAKCTGYVGVSGTSFAAPHAAGVAALVLHQKRMSRDELRHVLTTSAVDLGELGPDRAFGYGRVDAMAAISGIGGWVHYRSHLLQEIAGLANGDGELDPNERASLVVTLENTLPSGTAHNVSAVLSTTSPDVEIHDSVAWFPDIAAGGSAPSIAPHFSFTARGSCDRYISFHIRARYDDGQFSDADILVRVGSEQAATVFSDDFETDKGWSRTGTATGGLFVRDDPHQALNAGVITQPEDDHTPAGTKCWVTGNANNSTASVDDVDGGGTYIVSPRFSVLGYTKVRGSLWHFLYLAGQGFLNFDIGEFELSGDDGATWEVIRSVVSPGPRAWTRLEFPFEGVPMTSTMRLRLKVTDNGTESIVDGAFDDVLVQGTRIVCDSYSPPTMQAPNSIGSSLRLARQARDIRLDWSPSPIDATHDAADAYPVSRADSAIGAFGRLASPTATTFIDVDESLSPAARFYLVGARNSGGEALP